MPEETIETVEEPKETGKGLRAQLEKTIAEKNDYKTQLLSGAYESLNLDPTVGLGKAIAKEYDGAPNAEALAAYAMSEYEYSFTPEPEAHPQAGIINEGTAQIDSASQGAGSVPVAPTNQEALAEAEAKGDYATAMTIKSQQVADDLFQPRR